MRMLLLIYNKKPTLYTIIKIKGKQHCANAASSLVRTPKMNKPTIQIKPANKAIKQASRMSPY